MSTDNTVSAHNSPPETALKETPAPEGPERQGSLSSDAIELPSPIRQNLLCKLLEHHRFHPVTSRLVAAG